MDFSNFSYWRALSGLRHPKPASRLFVCLFVYSETSWLLGRFEKKCNASTKFSKFSFEED